MPAPLSVEQEVDRLEAVRLHEQVQLLARSGRSSGSAAELKLRAIALGNAGGALQDDILDLEELARQEQHQAPRVFEGGEILTPNEKNSVTLLQGILSGNMDAVDKVLSDPRYKPNTLFESNIPLHNAEGAVLPIATKGKAVLHLLPEVAAHSALPTAELPTIIHRLVRERGADVNLPSREGRTALEYAVEKRVENDTPQQQNILAVIDALVRNQALVTPKTIQSIQDSQDILAANTIITARNELPPKILLSDAIDFAHLQAWFNEQVTATTKPKDLRALYIPGARVSNAQFETNAIVRAAPVLIMAR